MSLKIRNPETHRLAEELAKRTGESMTAAVTTAVRECLDRARREQGAGLVERLVEIGNDCAKRLKEPYRSAAHTNCFTMIEGYPDHHRHVCADRYPSRILQAKKTISEWRLENWDAWCAGPEHETGRVTVVGAFHARTFEQQRGYSPRALRILTGVACVL